MMVTMILPNCWMHFRLPSGDLEAAGEHRLLLPTAELHIVRQLVHNTDAKIKALQSRQLLLQTFQHF